MTSLRRISLALASLCLLFTTGCAWAAAPVTGVFYSQLKGPIEAPGNGNPTKVGHARCTSYAGFVALGDASIEAAAKAGGITKIHHVDFDTFSIAGFYATFTTTVYGE